MKKICPECAGSGRAIKKPVPWPRCTQCDGEGVVSIDLMGLVTPHLTVTVHQ